FRQRFHLNTSPLISGSPESFVTCFAENKQNENVYIGTFDAGIVEWDRKENSYIAIPGLNYKTTGGINDLKISSGGKLLVACDKGTFVYTPELKKTESLTGITGTFSQILIGDGETVFLFCRKAGALKYNLDLHHADTLISAKEQWSQHIFSALRDEDGSFWLGTFISGITHCTASGQLIQTFTSPKTGGPLYNIFSITKDHSGAILFSSNEGLIEIKPGALIPKLYTTADGLPSNFVYYLCCDKRGNLWLNTNRGLSLRDAATKSFRNFSRQDGLLFESLTAGSLLLSDGTILCGEERGFLSFDPEKSTDNVIPPPVILTSVKLMGKEAGFIFSDTDFVHELSYDNNQLMFEFAALNYVFPERNRYQYKLEGVDNNWIPADYTHNSASYSALPPGKYIFYVKACNNDGTWNEKGIRYQFIIHPPFWERWWFRILSLLIISAIVYSIYRYRIKQIVKLERMRNKIASDLHDDIGSALSSISIYSEIVSQKSGTEDRNSKMIEQIGETSREMLENMNDI
ncbi:MAG TPA: triple tyrosine motif-containing protein, partial [Bacteroidia bacterium]|nr:triple tyrosine motif-containing protein [Bacteroidia bacterium]